MNDQFERLVPLYGENKLNMLAEKTVAVIGLGGVGAIAAESLCRMGVGTLIIMDKDVITKSNINRLITASYDTIGKNKTWISKARLLSINPNCKVIDYNTIFNDNMVEPLFAHPIDFIFDAIDSVKSKALLIEHAQKNTIPIISSVGQGNRKDSSQIVIKNLFDTSYDPLAKKLRIECRKKGINEAVPVVFSKEQPLKDSTIPFIASNPFGPATAGLRAAEYICLTLMEG